MNETTERMIDSRAFARMTLVDAGLDEPSDGMTEIFQRHIDKAIRAAFEEIATALEITSEGQSMFARKIAQREEAAREDAARAVGALGSGMNHEPPGD